MTNASLVRRYERAASYVTIIALLGVASFTWRDRIQTVLDHGAADESQSFWTSLQVVGCEVEGYQSLEQMAAAADTVAKGRFTEFALSRTIRGDVPSNFVHYGVATFEVTEWVRRPGRETTLLVEFLLPSPAAQTDEMIAALAADLPRDELVLFLRSKGGDESKYYRIVNSAGLWAAGPSGVVTPLISSEQPSDHNVSGQALYASELTGVARLDDFVRILRF